MAPPHPINTKSAPAVALAVKQAFLAAWPKQQTELIDHLFSDVTAMFTGKFPGYQAIDMFYHDFEHTLQATVCMVHILQGRQRSGDKPVLSHRDWELGLIAVLLHDTGYLKHTDDIEGTGAKYTLVHERRSCEFARAYLANFRITPLEIDDVCAGIMCTGPHTRINSMPFRREDARLLACALVTADYLAQMSATDYVDELPILFAEFNEAFEFEHVPAARRPYNSITELLEKTPVFWENYVRPMLDFEAGAMHRYLTTAGQPNPYLQAVEANIAEVHRRLKTGNGTP